MLLAHPDVAEEFTRLEVARQDTASQVSRQDIYCADRNGLSVGVEILDFFHGPSRL
jgi:hypothetical protein